MFKTSVLGLILVGLALSAPVQAVTRNIEFSRTVTFDGVTVTFSVFLTVDTEAKTLVGTVSIAAVNNTSGETIFSKTITINLNFATSNMIKFVLEIPLLPLALAVDCVVDVTAHSASCIVSRSPDANRNGRVDIIDFASLAISYGQTIDSTRYNPATDLNANRVVDIVDAALMALYYGAPVLR